MVFPATPLGIVVEIAFGADLTASSGNWTWVDVSQYVVNSSEVLISRGASDDRSTIATSSASVVLNNTDGRWNPYLATGPYYGQLGLDTPIRIRVDPGFTVSETRRFTGFISEMNPNWSDGPDKGQVRVQASGIMRRAERFNSELSAMRWFMQSQANDAIAYWPLEDEAGAGTAAPALSTHGAAAAHTGVTFASDPGPGGTLPLPKLNVTASITGSVPGSSSTTWASHIMYKGSVDNAAYVWLMSVTTGGTAPRWEVRVDNVGVQVFAYDADGVQIYSEGGSQGDTWDGQWHTMYLRVTPSGSDLLVYVALDGAIVQYPNLSSRTSAPVLKVSASNTQWIATNNLDELWVGHLAVFDNNGPSVFTIDDAITGFLYEEAAPRFSRIAGYLTSLVGTSTGSSDDQRMGVQKPGHLMGLLREVQEADGGIIHEAANGALTYLARSQIMDTVLDDTKIWATLTVNDVYSPFYPMCDDANVVTDVTASRPDGGSRRYAVESATKGSYTSSVTVNVPTDDELLSQASWRVYRTALVDYRYPQIAISFTGAPHLLAGWIGSLGGVGSRFKIASGLPGMSSDPLDLIVVGYTETLSAVDWRVVLNTVPSRAWRFGVLDSSTHGRLDTAGSTLTSGITSTATSISVTTSTGPVWIQTAVHGAQFPFSIRVGGEDMTVTAITGTSSPQTFTVIRGVNGVIKAHNAGAAVNLRYPLVVGV